MESFKSKLYSKAKSNPPEVSKPKFSKKIINTLNFPLQDTQQTIRIEKEINNTKPSDYLLLPSINNKTKLDKKLPERPYKNHMPIPSFQKKLQSNPSHKLRLLKQKNKNYTVFLKLNYLKFIQLYLDPLSIKHFMLTCKKFHQAVTENDELWYYYYCKKFNTKKTLYNENRGKWKIVFLNSINNIFKTNMDSLKNKYLQKSKKNNYQSKKDTYFISNNLYSFLKPIYTLEIDERVFKIKHIFTNKILSHINFYANFDQEYIDLNKVKLIKLLITEKNLGLINHKLYEYDIKKKKLEQFEANLSKICIVYYDREFIISTFDKNLIFFLNISMPVCKICESIFDFMKGIHGENLNYFDDIDSKFGLYDYSLLINIKSWNNIFYTINVYTLDFKEEDGWLIYENDGKSKLH